MPEGDPSCPARPRLALPVGGEGQEGTEPRKVSGRSDQAHIPFSLLFLYCSFDSTRVGPNVIFLPFQVLQDVFEQKPHYMSPYLDSF